MRLQYSPHPFAFNSKTNTKLIILKAINLVFILSFYFHTNILQYTNVLIQWNFIFQSLIPGSYYLNCHTNFDFYLHNKKSLWYISHIKISMTNQNTLECNIEKAISLRCQYDWNSFFYILISPFKSSLWAFYYLPSTFSALFRKNIVFIGKKWYY